LRFLILYVSTKCIGQRFEKGLIKSGQKNEEKDRLRLRRRKKPGRLLRATTTGGRRSLIV
jgi:hypothetical protein